jgi:hypothetical protein
MRGCESCKLQTCVEVGRVAEKQVSRKLTINDDLTLHPSSKCERHLNLACSYLSGNNEMAASLSSNKCF